MKPKTKILALTFSLILPYLALAMYFALRIQEHPLPTWFPYFGLSYILGTIVVVLVFSRKIYRDAQPATVQRPVSALGWIGRVWVGYLVAVWAGLFLWGTYETILGTLKWQRALPAGVFLLAFIALFSWSLYKDTKRRTRRGWLQRAQKRLTKLDYQQSHQDGPESAVLGLELAASRYAVAGEAKGVAQNFAKWVTFTEILFPVLCGALRGMQSKFMNGRWVSE